MSKLPTMFFASMLVMVMLSLSACGTGGRPAAGDGGHPAGHPTESAEDSAAEHGGHGAQGEKGTHAGEHGDGNGDGRADEQGAGHSRGDLQASFAYASGGPQANKAAELTVSITDRNGEPVNGFEANHEKLMHLIVVSEDLAFFSHIHPEYEGDGRFTVRTTYPAGGVYRLYADFVPSGGAAATLSGQVEVEGAVQPSISLVPDRARVKEVDGKEVELILDGARPGADAKLTFHIKDAQTKRDIDNLQPYLGAVGHVVILSEDGGSYLHVHPLEEAATGPVAEFGTSFPRSGIYKLWGQFQHKGKVFTVPFVIAVE